MADIYDEAVADAKKLRQKTTQVVEQQLLEKFRPKIDRYIERALLEADGDDDDDSENILLGVDVAGSEPVGDDIAADVAASIEGGADGEAAALQINSDGTVTLDLDKIVVEDPAGAAPEGEKAGKPNDAVASSAVTAAANAVTPETLSSKDVSESLTKLDALRQLVDQVEDKYAAFDRLGEAFNKVTNIIGADKSGVGRAQIAGLTSLAERINDAYVVVRNATTINSQQKNQLCEKFERTYATVNNTLVNTVYTKITKRISLIEKKTRFLRTLNEGARKKAGLKVYEDIDSMCRILEAIDQRGGSSKTTQLKNKIATLVKEINTMTTRRKPLNEEEIMLRLDVPDEDTKARIVDALGGVGDDDGGDMESDDDLDSLFGDDESSDDGDDEGGLSLEGDDYGAPDTAMESRAVARDLASLFEADDAEDESELDVDLGGGDEGESDGEGESDDSGDFDDEMTDEPSAGGHVADVLSKIADIIDGAEGDVSIDVVDDEGTEQSDDDDIMGLDLSDESGESEESIDMGGDEEVEEMMAYEADEPDDDSEEIVEVDMRHVASALREMDTSYHKHDSKGPSKGHKSFGGATESSEPFAGEELEESFRRRTSASRSTNRMSEGARPSTPTAREVYRLRQRLAESERKQGENNLLSAKLLYTNKLLQRSDLSEVQRGRIVDAMDEAGNLREAQLLYKNLVRAFDKRANRLSEGQQRPIGSSSQVITSGGFSRKSDAVSSEHSMLNENIDIDLWKRHAGLE